MVLRVAKVTPLSYYTVFILIMRKRNMFACRIYRLLLFVIFSICKIYFFNIISCTDSEIVQHFVLFLSFYYFSYFMSIVALHLKTVWVLISIYINYLSRSTIACSERWEKSTSVWGHIIYTTIKKNICLAMQKNISPIQHTERASLLDRL